MELNNYLLRDKLELLILNTLRLNELIPSIQPNAIHRHVSYAPQEQQTKYIVAQIFTAIDQCSTKSKAIPLQHPVNLMRDAYILRNTLMEFTDKSHVSTKHIVNKLNAMLQED